MSATRSSHEPQPLPARVAAMTPPTVRWPSRTQATNWPLLTPLQLQTCASSASSAAPASGGAAPMSNSSLIRSSGSGTRRSKAWVSDATLLTSPNRVAPTSTPSRMITVW